MNVATNGEIELSNKCIATEKKLGHVLSTLVLSGWGIELVNMRVTANKTATATYNGVEVTLSAVYDYARYNRLPLFRVSSSDIPALYTPIEVMIESYTHNPLERAYREMYAAYEEYIYR